MALKSPSRQGHPRRHGAAAGRQGTTLLLLTLWLGSWLAQGLALWHAVDHRPRSGAAFGLEGAVDAGGRAKVPAAVHGRDLAHGPSHDWGHAVDSGDCRLIDQLLTGQAPWTALPAPKAAQAPAGIAPAAVHSSPRRWPQQAYLARAPPIG